MWRAKLYWKSSTKSEFGCILTDKEVDSKRTTGFTSNLSIIHKKRKKTCTLKVNLPPVNEKKLKEYKFIQCIGKGRFGKVYKCRELVNSNKKKTIVKSGQMSIKRRAHSQLRTSSKNSHFKFNLYFQK